MISEIFVGVSTRIFVLVSVTFSSDKKTFTSGNIRETSFNSVMANAVIVERVCVLHKRDPILWLENEHHSITTTMGVRAPCFQGSSPLRVVHEPEGDVVIARHW
jgi:hypothetical protein